MKSIVLLQGESCESYTPIILNPYWTNDQGELTGGWMVEDNCELRIVGDRTTRYGSWLRRNDPIGFEVGYQDEKRGIK